MGCNLLSRCAVIKFKGEDQYMEVRGRLSNFITLRDKRELIIRLDKVYYFTIGNKVGLRNIGPETAEISRNIDLSKKRGSPTIITTAIRAVLKGQRTKYCAVMACEPLPALHALYYTVSSPIHGGPACVLYSALQYNQRSALTAAWHWQAPFINNMYM